MWRDFVTREGPARGSMYAPNAIGWRLFNLGLPGARRDRWVNPGKSGNHSEACHSARATQPRMQTAS